MERVLGIGGIFFKSKNPKALIEWYRTHLGIEPQWDGGTAFVAKQGDMTVWSVFSADTAHFNPSPSPFMLNFRVANLAKMLDQLRAMGAQVDGRTELSEFGNFGWVHDPDGNRVELWEPPK
jgi:catechol 2,3-dioxygenase-like lactoylglutathione lyase family enzyme